MTVVDTSNGSPASQAIDLNNLALVNTIGEAAFTGATTSTTMATTSGLSATQPLLLYQSRVIQVVIPEPATFGFLGVGLLCLGLTLILAKMRRHHPEIEDAASSWRPMPHSTRQ